MTDPILAAIDQLRAEIARRHEAIAALERVAGVTTVPAVPMPQQLVKQMVERRDLGRLPAPKPAETKRNQHSGKVDPDRVREMHAEGKNDLEIGAALGVSGSAITLWRKKLGLSPNSKGGRKRRTAGGTGVETVNSAATIVTWLRQRDTVIAELEPGKAWKVNGRDVIDRAGLLTMANRKRDLMSLPRFQWEFGG